MTDELDDYEDEIEEAEDTIYERSIQHAYENGLVTDSEKFDLKVKTFKITPTKDKDINDWLNEKTNEDEIISRSIQNVTSAGDCIVIFYYEVYIGDESDEDLKRVEEELK